VLLCRHFVTRRPRFVLHPSARDDVRFQTLTNDPELVETAEHAATRIIDGSYDLLGYEGLHWGPGSRIDWQLDPVTQRRAPLRFWADVSYLDPSIGDHKVIWELNRHQHWLVLGRAWWLTSDRRFRDEFVRQLESWLAANPPLVGLNWVSALELALRSLSWLWALEFFASPDPGRSAWSVDLLLGIDRQLRHVERNLSVYFSPNTHLLGEGLSLYVCGQSLPELAASSRWARVGREVLFTEADRQVLADGVHAERSAHYHRYALDFYLLALSVARITGDQETGERLTPVVRALAGFMRDVSDWSGRFPLIGDDDGGELCPIAGPSGNDASSSLGWASVLLGCPGLAVGPRPEPVVWLTGVLRETSPETPQTPACAAESHASSSYPAAGYYISRLGRSHLVFDAGCHGFLTGGHAHADALAVTLVADGLPLLVDSGTATYVMDPRSRDYFRSSHAHNTLTIDGRSQSRPAGPFHWATAARASAGRIVHNPRFDYFEGTTDAYAPVLHQRSILALDDERWVVGDRVTGAGRREAALHWHLDPAWTAASDGRDGVELTHDSGRRAHLFTTGGRLEIVRGDASGLGWISPSYGRVVPADALRCRVIRPAPFTIATVIEAARVRAAGHAAARTLEVLTSDTAGTTFAVAAARDGCVEMTLFASGPRETATVLFEPRSGLTVTTDARMLHARMDAHDRLVRLCAVECSIARFEGGNTLTLMSDIPVADIDIEVDGTAGLRAISTVDLSPVHIALDTNRSAADPAPAPCARTTRVAT
jgi:hypothetical protein